MSVATERVMINGNEEKLPSGMSVAQLLELRGVQTTLVAVERNGRILRRAEFSDTIISSGDKLEIVHFVGGG